MNWKLLFLCIVFGGLMFFANSDINAQIKDKIIKPPKSALKISPPSKFENEILEEINFARTKPAEYAKMLEGMKQYYDGNTFKLPERISSRTIEGIKSLNEAIEVLKVLKPLEPVAINCSAVRASRDQLGDLQKSGAFTHFGSDGSSPQERLKKYLSGTFYSSENLSRNTKTVRDIIRIMILDDGLPSRQHRKNLLDSRFKFVGISNGDDINKLNVSVIVFSDSSADKEPCDMK